MQTRCPDWQTIRARMNATGIGYAGIDGVWWQPAAQPFVLPSEAHAELLRIAESTFALFDAVTDLYETNESQRILLDHKVPPHL